MTESDYLRRARQLFARPVEEDKYLIEQVIRNMYFDWTSRARQSMMKHEYCTLDKVYMLV